MYDEYIEFFKTGNIEKHKDSQRYWVKDKSPVVEFNIGWIETYKDPKGIRGYYEGWVALTDKEKSKKYGILVQNAEKLLESAPWPKDFEKSKFISPDFIALDVLCLCTSGCPIGINIPNYLDVQETDGFKNIITFIFKFFLRIFNISYYFFDNFFIRSTKYIIRPKFRRRMNVIII